MDIKFTTMKYIKNERDEKDRNKILCELNGNQQFYIILPKEKDDYHFIELPIILDGFSWLNKINEFIFNKNPDLQTLVNHIESEYSNQTRTKTLTKKKVDIFNVPELEIDMFDLDERKYRRELEAKISLGLMKSKLNLNANDNMTALFSGKVPGTLIMNEFFELRKKFSRNANIKLSLDNNNIYTWNIQFTNFTNQKLHGQLQELSRQYKYDYIEVEIHFHDKLYPGYPPFIRVVRPRLEDGLMNHITNMKMVQLEYWSPCRGMAFIINKLYDTLNNHSVVEINSEMNDLTKYTSGAYHNLEAILVKLAALCSLDKTDTGSLDTEVYNRVIGTTKIIAKESTSSKKKDTIWKKGTGYGHNSSTDWDPNEYVKMQEEKDKQIKSVLTIVMDTLHTYKEDELPTVYNIIKNSYLLPFIKSHLQGANMLDMGKRFEMYQFIILFMQILATEQSIFLFDSSQDSQGLYELLSILNREALQVAKLNKMNDTEAVSDVDNNYDIATMICALYEMITPIFEIYLENKKKFQLDEKEKWNNKIEKAKSTLDDVHEKYLNIMDSIKFDTAKFISPYCYTDNLKKGTPTKMMTKRLASEYASMINSLPTFFESSIFVRVNEIDNRAAKILITGPEDTPYNSGCLIFDLYTGDDISGKCT